MRVKGLQIFVLIAFTVVSSVFCYAVETAKSTSAAKKECFQAILDRLPKMPTASSDKFGGRYLKPAENHNHSSWHCPEMFPLFPYELHGIGQGGLQLMKNTSHATGKNRYKTIAWQQANVFSSAPQGWPSEVKAVRYSASYDKTLQPMLMYRAKANDKRPLLVGLHTWSGGYDQAGGEVVYARWCMENDWHFIHPDFRGPNYKPEACGSEMMVQDIIDAVEYMKKHHNVDTDRIYLVGVSGGGYAALLMAGRAPDVWAGVSAWASISDLRSWWDQKKPGKYAVHIEKAVGGKPDVNEKAAAECIKRSAITYLEKAAGVNLDINAGITDGHQGGSVPFTHSLYAFNQIVPEKDQIDSELIEAFYEKQSLPKTLDKAEKDSLYGSKQPVFRKVSNNTRVTIFDGRHEIIHTAALNWLSKQRKGKPANWIMFDIHDLKTTDKESNSGQ